MRQHPLDGQMRLAGVGRAQHRGDAGAWRPVTRERRRRQSHLWVFSSGAYLLVIARSDSDEAIHASASSEMDCFASLAMTKNSEIPSLPATTPARSVSDCDDSSDHMGFGFTVANGCGTNRGRIADSLW